MVEDEISFGRFRLDLARRELRRDETLVRLGSRALDILCVLAAAGGKVVTKDELMERVWAGVVVEEHNIQVHISALRKALAEDRDAECWIVTVPGRGYRLVRAPEPPAAADAAAEPSAPDPEQPSLTVLPFLNLSGDPEQEYFADGMVEEITTALSRIRWLSVVARNSSFTYKGQHVDVKRVGRELGVRYVLEGSVRKSANRVRITAQLIDANTGAHLWADHFDGPLEDVFDLQDKVASSVAGVIEPTLEAAEIRRSDERPTTDLTAYDLYLRALAHHHSFEKDRVVQALDLLGQAIERDPGYGPALALAAHCHTQLDLNGWTDDRETNRHTGLDLARRALRVAADDPDVLARVAYLLGYFGEDIDAAIGLMDRALASRPSLAHGWFWSAFLRLFAGQPDIAIEHFERYRRLSPRDLLLPRCLSGIGTAHFFNRRFEEAAKLLLMSLEELPTYAPTHRFLAASYAHLGGSTRHALLLLDSGGSSATWRRTLGGGSVIPSIARSSCRA
jgi:TolB-like protein